MRWIVKRFRSRLSLLSENVRLNVSGKMSAYLKDEDICLNPGQQREAEILIHLEVEALNAATVAELLGGEHCSRVNTVTQ